MGLTAIEEADIKQIKEKAEQIKIIVNDLILCRDRQLIEGGLHIIERKVDKILERVKYLEE